MGFFARVVLLTLLLPSPAIACSCGIPFGEKHDQRVARILGATPIVVIADVLSAKATREHSPEGGDPLIVTRAKIIRAIKGKIPQIVTIASDGLDNGANCGRGSWLIEAYQLGKPIPLALTERKKDGRYYVAFCSDLFDDDIPLLER